MLFHCYFILFVGKVLLQKKSVLIPSRGCVTDKFHISYFKQSSCERLTRTLNYSHTLPSQSYDLIFSVVDPDLELSGKEGGGGGEGERRYRGGFVLLGLPAFLPFVISFIFRLLGGGGVSGIA